MRQAIRTRYCGPTDHRGARVKAMCDAKVIYVPWDHAKDVTDNHTHAASTLAMRLGWSSEWLGGSAGDEYVYVCADTDGWTSDSGRRPLADMPKAKPRAKPLSKGSR